MNNVFQKKESIQYPRFIKLIIADLMKKFPNIPKRLEEEYHSIKDDVPLLRTNRNTPRAPKTPTVFASPQESKKRKQTARESSSRRVIIKNKKPNTPSIPPPGDDRERDEMAKATILSLTLHKTALDAEAKENITKVQEILEQEEIDKLVDGDEDEDSYASAFANSVINNDDDDTGSMLEPENHKKHPEHVSDDDEMKKKDEEVEKEKEVVEIVKETNVDDISAKKNNEVVMEKEVVDMSGSQEIRKEQKKYIRSHIKTKFITREFFVEKIKEVIQHCDKIVPELTVTKTNGMLKKEMPRLVKLAVNKDREVSPVDISSMVSKEFAAHGPKLIEELFQKHMQNTTLNLYPKIKSSTATTSSADLQQQLILRMGDAFFFMNGHCIADRMSIEKLEELNTHSVTLDTLKHALEIRDVFVYSGLGDGMSMSYHESE
ncbi:hypothetical protein Tco_1347998 [Tanacetum coccineum]